MAGIDTNILHHLKHGDSQAFTVWFEQYWQLLFAAAYRRLGDEALAQDMVQNVFMQVWDKRGKINLRPDYVEFYLNGIRCRK